MKFTVVITILDINEETFSLIDNTCLQSIDDLQVILSIPNIFNKKDVDKLKEYIKNINNIEILELGNDNINYGRNQSILKSNADYIMFINSNEKIKGNNVLEIIYNKMIYDDLDMITYDFTYIEKYEKDTSEIENIKSKEVLNTKKQFIENKSYEGKKFYKKLSQKELFIDSLFLYCYKVNFIKSNNIIFDESLVNNSLLFINDSLIKCKYISYLSNDFIQEHKYNSIFLNYNFLKYNCIDNGFEVVDKLIERIKDQEISDVRYSIVNQIYILLASFFGRIKANNQYTYIDKIYVYFKKLKKILNTEDMIDIEIKTDMFIDAFQTYERYKSDYVKHEGKNVYNDIYILQEIINYVSVYKNVDENNMQRLNHILNNNNYLKFKSVDILKQEIINFDLNCEDTELNIFICSINEVQKDIESIVNNKLTYYRYFEKEFDKLLENI